MPGCLLFILWVIGVGADDPPLSIRITSPLGRTGSQGTVRIVAQIRARPEAVLSPVQFYVDSALLATDTDGPPYATEWIDENPFEPHEITVQVQDELGQIARDTVRLKAFEIIEVTQVSGVLLEASVQDQRRRFVSGLGASNFFLLENGVPQMLQIVTQEEVAATFALLIDSSQSMSRRIDFVREAAGRLAGFLRPKDRVMVAPFTRQLGAVTGPTDDRRTVMEAISAIRPGGGTAILDGLVEITRRLPAEDGRRVVVLVTDGYDENSTTKFDDALAAVKTAQVTVYVIGIGGVAGISLQGERLLKRIATETGGQAFFPPRQEELAAVYDLLAADAQNRYLITYTPTNQKADGTWRAVTVKTTPTEYTVRTRAGYLAPRPAPIRPALEFTVTDLDRQYVDVTADDLLVLEDGVEQTVETFQEAVTPVSIVLALDSSGSMRKSAEAVVEAARDFVGTLRPEDGLAVVLFSDKSVFAHDLTTNRESPLEAIAGYQATGGTALYDAMSDALIRLKRAEGRRVVVVLTDGRDEDNAGTGPGSRRVLADVLKLIKETDATIFPIALGPSVDRAPLEEFSTLSGGEAYFPVEVASLRTEYRRIVENLRRRYVLSYTSTNTARDGGWRKVEIRSRSANLVVKSRGGYFAPDS